MIEEWRAIKEWPAFEVSSAGQVRQKLTKEIKKPWISGAGYLYVDFWVFNKGHHRLVSRLVALAFLPEPLPGQTQVAHNDGCTTNNVYDNLRWDSPTGNAADRLAHETHARGEQNPMHVLSEDDVLEIRRLRRKRLTQAAIAERFGVCRQTVSDIERGKRWGWL